MKLIPTLAIIVLFIPVGDVCAQQSSLKGKVSLAGPRDRGNEIKIQVRNRGTGQFIDGEQPNTRIEDWFHVAPLYALVDVEFDGGPCYRGDGHSQIRVKKFNADLPQVILQKTRECKIKERRQVTRVASAGGGGEVGMAPHSGGMASIDKQEARTAEIGKYSSEDNLIPSPTELKQELDEEAAHARNGGFFDTFQYKFALKAELYRDRPELMKVLSEFRTNKENSVFFQAIGQVRPEMFTDVVRRELEAPGDVNLDNVFAVVREESASQNIRGAANVALLNGSIPDDKLSQIRAYFRQQSPSSPIFVTSLVGLGRIGEADDQKILYRYIASGSRETSSVAMEALYYATLIKGTESFSQGSETLADVAANNEDPALRASAFRSLRAFAYQGDETALKALVEGSTDKDPAVRLQAVLALGVGKTEQSSMVRSVLRRISLTDSSRWVRDAARVALSGAPTTGSFSSTVKLVGKTYPDQ
ncbi:MAG TPA: HEAT repeat domain-containing protein [Pyrinomonadaceae bacterium]|nr:HEAT repeat domain-containing protein [Pyrinomonadaceae bacterium]